MIDKINKYIDNLDGGDFFHYLSPESYYNSDIDYSIYSIPWIETRKVLDIYYCLKDNRDLIFERVYERMMELINEPDEIEMNGLNWYVLIFILMDKNPEKYYNNLFTPTPSKIHERIIELNNDFKNKNYFIINDVEQKESFYTDDLKQCAFLLADRDKKIDFEKLIKNQSYSSEITIKKNDYILYTDFNKLDYSKRVRNSIFLQKVENEYKNVNRELKLNSLFESNKILSYQNYSLIMSI